MSLTRTPAGRVAAAGHQKLMGDGSVAAVVAIEKKQRVHSSTERQLTPSQASSATASEAAEAEAAVMVPRPKSGDDTSAEVAAELAVAAVAAVAALTAHAAESQPLAQPLVHAGPLARKSLAQRA